MTTAQSTPPYALTDPPASEASAATWRQLLDIPGAVWPFYSAAAGYGLELSQLAQSGTMTDGYQLLTQNKSAQALRGVLKTLHYKGESLLVSGKVAGVDDLHAALTKASLYLQVVDPKTPHPEFDPVLEDLGLDKGWGDTAKKARDTIDLLLHILKKYPHLSPAAAVAEFFSAVAHLFNTVFLCPHDYFAHNHGVMGNFPYMAADRYILDQVHAIQEAMIPKYKEQGLEDAVPIMVPSPPSAVDTRSALALEPAGDNTRYANITRFPFSMEKGGILGQRMCRFDGWPYLDVYTEEVVKGVLEEFDGASWPDQSVNNYNSDGILAASLPVHRLDVTQGNLGHAEQLEGYYHFPCRFSSYSLPQPVPVYSTIAGNTTTARPTGVWDVQASKGLLPTHVAPGVSPTNRRIWRSVGTTAVLSLLGITASTLALLGVDTEQLVVSMLFAMAQVGFLAMFNMLRNHKD